MLKSIFCLSLFATPLLAQPIGFDSLAKRDGPVTLLIYINSAIFPDSEALKLVNLSIDDPDGTQPIPLPLPTSNDTAIHTVFTRVVEDPSLPKTVNAACMTEITLTAGEGMRNYTSVGLGEGLDMNCNITLSQPTEFDRIAYIIPWGLFMVDGGQAPGSDVLLIECEVLNCTYCNDEL